MEEQMRTELEAAAFRRLVEHFRERSDVQNIDLMELATVVPRAALGEAPVVPRPTFVLAPIVPLAALRHAPIIPGTAPLRRGGGGPASAECEREAGERQGGNQSIARHLYLHGR